MSVLLADVLAELALLSADPFDVAELLHVATDRACEVLAADGLHNVAEDVVWRRLPPATLVG